MKLHSILPILTLMFFASCVKDSGTDVDRYQNLPIEIAEAARWYDLQISNVDKNDFIYQNKPKWENSGIDVNNNQITTPVYIKKCAKGIITRELKIQRTGNDRTGFIKEYIKRADSTFIAFFSIRGILLEEGFLDAQQAYIRTKEGRVRILMSIGSTDCGDVACPSIKACPAGQKLLYYPLDKCCPTCVDENFGWAKALEAFEEVRYSYGATDCKSFNFVATTNLWQEAAVDKIQFRWIWIGTSGSDKSLTREITLPRIVFGLPTKYSNGEVLSPGQAAVRAAEVVNATKGYILRYFKEAPRIPRDETVIDEFKKALHYAMTLRGGTAGQSGTRSSSIVTKIEIRSYFSYYDCD